MKLCIDPGHGFSNRTPGRYDPGAVGGGVAEADVVLLWALTLKFHCVRAGIPFWMTRDDSTDVTPLGTRDERALANGCTHFLSLHCNSSKNLVATGTETIYRDGKAFANIVQQCGLYAMERRDRGTKTEGQLGRRLSVLDFPQSALLEIGFISNREDRNRMLQIERRVAFAEALVRNLRKMP